MPLSRPSTRRLRHLVLALAAGAAVGTAAVAWAQENQNPQAARRPAAEQQEADPVQPTAAGTTYQPASEGALPEAADPETGTEENIFSDEPLIRDTQTDPFSPSTRRGRTRAALPSETASRAGAAVPAGTVAREVPPADDPAPPAVLAEPRTGPSTTPETTAGEEPAFESTRTLRVAPLEAPPGALLPPAADDPYAPLGIRVGSFVLRPTLEQGIAASTNPAGSATGGSGTYSETVLRLNAESDWSRHQATLNAYGTVRRPLSGEEDVEEINGGLEGRLRLDLAEGWDAQIGALYTARPESASSPVPLAAGAEDRPLRQTIDAEAEVERSLGLLRLGVTGVLQRDWYGDVTLTDGSVLSQAERDSTLVALRTRMGYELSPAVIPFVELETGRRFFDVETDSAGIERSSVRGALRAGVELDLREKFGGEVAVGYLRETFDDDALEPAEGLVLDANLRWSPDRRTTVALRGSTTVEGTTAAGESGSLLYDLRTDVERTLLANLTGNAALGAAFRDYVGSEGRETTLFAETGLVWWFNRSFGLTGRLRHERLESNLPGRDYDATSVFVGLRVQR